MHIMAQNRLPLGSNISHFVSNVGRRARRMDAEFRHFFEDPAFGLGPLRPGKVADAVNALSLSRPCQQMGPQQGLRFRSWLDLGG